MPNYLYDYQISFEGGQDGSFPPNRIQENQYSKGINVTTEKGVLQSRPGWDKKELKFPKEKFSYRYDKYLDVQTLFRGCKFQAQAPYQVGGRYYQLVVISGVIFMIDQITLEVQILTTSVDTLLNENAPRINWSPAGRFLVFHDFPDRPVIVEGQSARRASADANELPVSTMGVYNTSRYFFANAGNEFSAGDVIGNDLTPDAPISINEISAGGPYVGDIYQLPSEYDRPITAMGRLQATDESTGIGQIIVATDKEVFTYNTTVPRDQWAPPKFGSMLLYEAGVVGPRAIINVNSDLFIVSADGQLRALSASRDDQRQWARVPLSVEVQNWAKYISEELKKYTVLGYFKNRLFWAIQPYRVRARKLDGTPVIDVAHRGLAVLETANISRLNTESPPAWAGLWTGVRPLDMNVNNERMFIMSKDPYSRNELYELVPELNYDRAGTRQRSIRSVIYSREYSFKDLFKLKDIISAQFSVSNIVEDFYLELAWKPSHASEFIQWSTFSYQSPYKYTEICEGKIPQRLPVSFREINFGITDSQEGNPVTQDLYDTFTRMQLKIAVTGRGWQLNEYRITARPVETNAADFIGPLESKEILLTNTDSDFDYEDFGA